MRLNEIIIIILIKIISSKVHLVSTTTITFLHERFYTQTALRCSGQNFNCFTNIFHLKGNLLICTPIPKKSYIFRDIQKGIYTLQYVAVFWQYSYG